MTGLDASMLYMESVHAQTHTLKVAIIEPSGDEALSGQWITDFLKSRVQVVPVYGQRAVPTPLGLHHPLLVDDPDFDPAKHVYTYRVPAPGGRDERDAVIAKLCATPLDRSRPLWEVWVLEGLEGGAIACLCKLHHAIADGRVAANQLQALAAAPPAPPRRPPAAIPGRGQLVRAALRDRVRELSMLPGLVRHTARVVREVRAYRRSITPMRVPDLLAGGPTTRFRKHISAERAWATRSLPLSDMLVTAKFFGVTLNDVLLTMAGGAVRTLLLDSGELPATSLTAGVPVNTAGPEEMDSLYGNKWSTLVTTLGTDIADVVERLNTVHDTTVAAKRIYQIRGDMLEHWWQLAPAFLGPLMGLASRAGAMRFVHLPTATVSNVRGPDQALSLTSAASIDEFYSVGPLADGCGLNITAWSFAGRLNIAVVSGRDVLPDPGGFLDTVIQTWEQLHSRASSTGAAAQKAR
jgi:WS/DGAT/MGAT family acyltransferase